MGKNVEDVPSYHFVSISILPILTADRVCVYWLTNEAYTSRTKWPRVSSSPLRLHTLHDIGLENVKWNLQEHVRVCMCVRCARLGREDDSKCHLVVWGQPSQTHSSCRRCCHPPPHCLCKWCLQSPSNTWRFHPSPVALLPCRCLRLYKLSRRPSSPAAPCVPSAAGKRYNLLKPKLLLTFWMKVRTS